MPGAARRGAAAGGAAGRSWLLLSGRTQTLLSAFSIVSTFLLVCVFGRGAADCRKSLVKPAKPPRRRRLGGGGPLALERGQTAERTAGAPRPWLPARAAPPH